MSQNKIIKDKNNPVIINIPGVDLTLFTDIRATFKSDSRTLSSNPTSVVIKSATQLALYFNDTEETGSGYWVIDGIDEEHLDGRELIGESVGSLGRTFVC